MDYVVNSILNPNLAVKEQYVTKVFILANGMVLTGVVIDRDGPSVNYACTDGSEWVHAVEYTDDGVVDHNSWAIHPDQYTWDVLFCVNTPDDDVTGITLQWRYASDPDGLWRDLDELLDDSGDAFDYEPALFDLLRRNDRPQIYEALLDVDL